ncbi:hypothetical protein CVT24_007923 [Panaeolus cyanescens]|uniref:Uncharacterized protein n=1 Tax=Panaeolus cyanescens TaxID=181874 RepID=A0A409WWM0_9AGAR|nr:hypothetical protein CVT24_007923 [Panaeolus cyanescens]
MPEFAVVRRIVYEMNNPPHKERSRLRNKSTNPSFHMIGKLTVHENGCANEEGMRPTVTLHTCKDGESFRSWGPDYHHKACTLCVPDGACPTIPGPQLPGVPAQGAPGARDVSTQRAEAAQCAQVAPAQRAQRTQSSLSQATRIEGTPDAQRAPTPGVQGTPSQGAQRASARGGEHAPARGVQHVPAPGTQDTPLQGVQFAHAPDAQRACVPAQSTSKTNEDGSRTVEGSTVGAIVNKIGIEGRLMPVASRGKEIAFVIDRFAFRVCLSLEGHGFWLPTTMYKDILTSGTSPKHGHTMYRVPALHWRGPPGVRGYVRIILAFECEKYTWIFVDHTAALTVHIKLCRERPTDADMEIGSKFWKRMWSNTHGPSLVDEPEEAKKSLELWRQSCIKKRTAKAIFISVKDTQTVFNGYGAQETTDMLFSALIMPVMPTYAVCSNEETWARFKKAVFLYQQERAHLMDCKTSWTKLSYCSGDDPFRFLTSAHQHFLGHVSVFRRSWVKVPISMLEEAKKLGLFNWWATMENDGKAYVRKDNKTDYHRRQGQKSLPLYIRHGRQNARELKDDQKFVLVKNRELTVRNARNGVTTVKSYSPFCARFNPTWWASDCAPQFMNKDLRHHHNITTVGPYSFRLFVSANWTVSTVEKKPTKRGILLNNKAMTGRRRVTGFIRPRTMEIRKRK